MIISKIKNSLNPESILGSLAVICLFMPLVYFPATYRGFTAPKAAFFFVVTGLLLLVWVWGLIKKDFEFRASWVTLFFGLYLLVSLLSAIFGADFLKSVFGGYTRATGLLFLFQGFLFYLIITSALSRKKIEKLASFSIFVASGVALFGWKHGLGLDITPLIGRGSTLGNTTFMGAYLLLHVFLALYLFFRKSDAERYLYPLAAGFMIPPVVMASARAATGSIFGGLVLFGLIYFFLKIKSRKGKIITGGTLLVAGLVVLSVLTLTMHPFDSLLPEGRGAKAESALREEFYDRSDQRRYVFWEQATKGIKERPLLGHGPENFKRVYFENFNPELKFTVDDPERVIRTDRTHNLIYEKLVTRGFLGLAVFLLLLGVVVVRVIRSHLRGDLGPGETAALLSLLAAWFAQNLTAFDTVSSYLGLFLIIALIDILGPAKSWKPKVLFGAAGLLFALGWMSFLFYISFSILAATVYTTLAIGCRSAGEATYHIDQATRWDIIDGREIPFRIGDDFRELFEERDWDPERKKEVREVIVEILLEENERPITHENKLMAGKYLSDLGRSREARETLKRALRTSPENLNVYWELADLEAELGNPEGVRYWTSEAIELEDDFYYSYRRAVEAASKVGDREWTNQLLEKTESRFNMPRFDEILDSGELKFFLTE